jgi:hypothetical protein
MRADSSHFWIHWLGSCSTGGAGATTLAGLTDVAITAPANGEALKYDAASSKWTNQADATSAGGGGTVTFDDASTQRIDFIGSAIWFAIGLGLMLFVGTFTIKPLVGGRVAN